MKRIVTILLGALACTGIYAQTYMVDIGNPTKSELLHDAILVGNSGNETSLLVGLTNTDGTDRVMLTQISANSGGLYYQKKYNIAYPITAKEVTVINSVKIAHDINSASTTCMLAGSYTRTSPNGATIYGYGLFSMTIDYITGNVLSIKRWESSVTGVSRMSVAAICAGPGNKFYMTGTIKYANPELYTFVMALDQNNNLIWNKIDNDVPTLTASFNVSDIVYSPYTPTGVNEVVVAGHCSPYFPGVASNVFLRRFNAATGTLISQYLYSTGNTESHIISSIVPSRSALGVYDGFLISGTRTNNASIQCGWVIKTNTTGSAVSWSKSYTYNYGNGDFVVNNVTEAYYSGLYPYPYYLIGTATNGISGSTSDGVAIKIDANGSVIWCTSLTPNATAVNKNENCLVVTQHNNITIGFNVYGNRVNPSNPSLADMYSVRVADEYGYSSYYICQPSTPTPYSDTSITLAVSSYTTQNFAILNSSTLNQSITSLSNITPICYESLLIGGRRPGAESADILTSEKPELFPNPSTGIFTIKANSDEQAEIKIYTANGLLVRSETISSISGYQIDISDQPEGIYMLIIKTDNTINKYKLIKQGE